MRLLPCLAICVAGALALGKHEQEKDYGTQFHDWAMRLVQSAGNGGERGEGDADPYEDVAAYLRAAVRHDRTNALYLNDLGVTEMRMGQYAKAARRFRKGIRLLQLQQQQHHKLVLQLECATEVCDAEQAHEEEAVEAKAEEMSLTMADLHDNLEELGQFMDPDEFLDAGTDDSDDYDELGPWYNFADWESGAGASSDAGREGDRRVLRRQRIRHSVQEIPEITPEELMRRSVLPDGVATHSDDVDLIDTPFVVRGAAKRAFGWDVSKFSVTKLMNTPLPSPLAPPMVQGDGDGDGGDMTKLEQGKYSRLGSSRVDFYPHNMIDLSQTSPYFETIDTALRQLLRYFDAEKHSPEVYQEVDASESGTYIQWNMRGGDWDRVIREMLIPDESSQTHNAKEHGVPRALLERDWFRCLVDAQDLESRVSRLLDEYYLKTHWRMLLIGEAGAGMFNHKDTLRAPAWQVQVAGRKRWHICPSSQDAAMGRAGQINTFAPNYEKYPEMLKAECYETVVYPGDLIYYPEDYWHQTRSLDTPTVSIGSTSLSAASHALVAAELRRECGEMWGEDTSQKEPAEAEADSDGEGQDRGSGRIFAPNRELCQALAGCKHDWATIFAASGDSV